jgi:hypothetical protein
MALYYIFSTKERYYVEFQTNHEIVVNFSLMFFWFFCAEPARVQE